MPQLLSAIQQKDRWRSAGSDHLPNTLRPMHFAKNADQNQIARSYPADNLMRSVRLEIGFSLSSCAALVVISRLIFSAVCCPAYIFHALFALIFFCGVSVSYHQSRFE